MPDKRDQVRPICSNRKALHEFEVLDRLEAGLVLVGSEVKSLRQGRANLSDAYVKIEGGEAWLVGAHISHYSHANVLNHEPLRLRKLLLDRAQIRKLHQKVKEKGLTIVPLSMYFRGPWVKVEIAMGRGKRLHDKREDLRRKDDQREMDRATRHRG